MIEGFGEKVRLLRAKKELTREEFCGDETELSVRQLARIEAGTSTPNLANAQFIAQQLGVGLGELTDGKNLELPKRYRELKYQILRIPTYSDEDRLKVREEQLDEILINYYDNLPEAEQVLVDIIQARFEVFNSGNTDFGTDILSDYFEQVKKKKIYTINDLALIDLYLVCIIVTNFDKKIYKEDTYYKFVKNIFNQGDHINIEDLFFLNKLYLMICSVLVKKEEYIKLGELLGDLYQLIVKSQDFQRMPLYYMYCWQHSLYGVKNKSEAEGFFKQALIFAEMTSDLYLAEKLKEEWQRNITKS